MMTRSLIAGLEPFLDIPYMETHHELSPQVARKSDWATLVFDDVSYLDDKVAELGKEFSALGHEQYYSIVFSQNGLKAKSICSHPTTDTCWPEFYRFDESGFAPYTSALIFFSVPVRMLVFRVGSVGPVSAVGSESSLKNVFGFEARKGEVIRVGNSRKPRIHRER